MLEIIKEILISEKQLELNKKEEINRGIQEIKSKKNQQEILFLEQKLEKVAIEINELNNNFFSRLFHNKKLKKLYEEYRRIYLIKSNKLKSIQIEIDKLFDELYNFTHDEVLIEKEIQKIKQASSLSDLSINDEIAAKIIKEHSKNDEKLIIKAVFSNIKDNNQLESKEDIFKVMQSLYQTNSSQFVSSMLKVSPKELIDCLVDIGIIIDDDKIEILNNLTTYNIKPHNQIKTNNKLDNYFYNEIEKAFSNIENNPEYKQSIISKIMTLTVLVSIAKNNKKEKEKGYESN